MFLRKVPQPLLNKQAHFFFNQQRKMTTALPHVLKHFSNEQNPRTLKESIQHEFHKNPFAREVLTATEFLLSQKKLTIHQATSLAEDKAALSASKALFFYHLPEKKIQLPSSIDSSYQLMPLWHSPKNNFHENKHSYFVGSFLHECTHAVDDQLAELAISAKDRKALAREYEWLMTGTDFEDYEKAEMRTLCKALRADKIKLQTSAEQGDKQAGRLFYFINLIDATYTAINFLDEMKSFLVQMTTSGAFAAPTIQAYLPETTAWFFKQFVPKLHDGMEKMLSMENNSLKKA